MDFTDPDLDMAGRGVDVGIQRAGNPAQGI
jgi:hypothetical protein